MSRLFSESMHHSFDDKQRAHLANCDLCRHEYEIRSQALRLLGDSPEQPVGAEAEALLTAALDRALPQQRGMNWRWLFVLASSVALALLLLWAYATHNNTEKSGARFAQRSVPLPKAVGLRVFCSTENNAQQLQAQHSCPLNSTLVAAVHVPSEAAAHAFVFFVDATGKIHQAQYQDPNEAHSGVPVGSNARDEVLDAWIELTTASTGTGEVVVAVCTDCLNQHAHQAIQRRNDNKKSHREVLPEVYLESMFVQVIGGNP
jgi:hypothetical protein